MRTALVVPYLFYTREGVNDCMGDGLLSDSRARGLSYLAIIGGAVGVFLDMMGLGVVAAGGVSVAELSSQSVDPFSFAIVLGLALIMVLVGYELVEREYDKRSRQVGWLLLFIGAIFVLDLAGSTVTSPSALPVSMVWIGIGLSLLGETALIVGGAKLREITAE